MKEKFGWVHLSTGDLFRREVEMGTVQVCDVFTECLCATWHEQMIMYQCFAIGGQHAHCPCVFQSRHAVYQAGGHNMTAVYHLGCGGTFRYSFVATVAAGQCSTDVILLLIQGSLLADIMREGGMVPVEITLGLFPTDFTCFTVPV